MAQQVLQPASGPRIDFPEGFLAVVNLFDGGLAQNGSLKRPRFYAYSLAAVTLLLMGWLMLAPIERVVRGEGKVIPSGKNRVVQHLEGGVVSRIYVREGDKVKAGQTLVDISSVDADSQFKERSIKLAGLRSKTARLKAESDGTEMSAEEDRDADAAAWQLERQSFIGRKQKLMQSQAVLSEQFNQRQAEMMELASRSKNLANELATTQRQLETYETLLQRKAGSEMDVLEARLRVQRLVTQVSEVDQRLPQLRSAAREIQSKMQSELAIFRADARAELAQTTAEARGIEEEIRSRSERLRRTAIVSPVDGTINRVLVTSAGAVVRPGDPVAEVTPSGGDLVIESQVAPSDRAELRPGLGAVVKLAPYDYTLYGSLAAEVDEISADALADERGRTFYRVRLKVNADAVGKFSRPILPGMPMTADIVLSQRTVGSYILSSVLRFGGTALRDAR